MRTSLHVTLQCALRLLRLSRLNISLNAKLVLESLFLLELEQELADLIERNDGLLAFLILIIAVADVHRTSLHLGVSDDKDEVVLSDLAVTDLLWKRVLGKVRFGKDAEGPKLVAHLLSVRVDRLGDRDHQHLAGRDPERPDFRGRGRKSGQAKT